MKRMLMLALILSLLFAWGCAKKQVTVTEPEPPQEVTQEPEPAPEPPVTTPEPEPVVEEEEVDPYLTLPSEHRVVSGECLWWIAEYKSIYNDPFMWPLIYKANRDQIDDPDLIYPGQVFEIPRFFSMEQLKQSRRQAGAPAPYAPPQAANLPDDIRAELGWGS